MLSYLRQNFGTAVIAGTALALNNPSGHTLLQETGLRVAYSSELAQAREALNLPDMGFNQFRELAPIALTVVYNGDRQRIERAVQDLGGSNPFCLPTSGENEDDPTQFPIACHAVCSRKDGEEGKPTFKPKLL